MACRAEAAVGLSEHHKRRSESPMASIEKRIQISPTPELAVVLRRLSELKKEPQSRIVVELLNEAVPALMVMADALAIAKKSPQQAEAMMARMAARSINQLTQEQINFSELIKKKPGRKPKGASGRTT